MSKNLQNIFTIHETIFSLGIGSVSVNYCFSLAILNDDNNKDNRGAKSLLSLIG